MTEDLHIGSKCAKIVTGPDFVYGWVTRFLTCISCLAVPWLPTGLVFRDRGGG